MQFPLDHPKYLKHNLAPMGSSAGSSRAEQWGAGQAAAVTWQPLQWLCPAPLAASAGLNNRVLQPEDTAISKTLLNNTEALKEM